MLYIDPTKYYMEAYTYIYKVILYPAVVCLYTEFHCIKRKPLKKTVHNPFSAKSSTCNFIPVNPFKPEFTIVIIIDHKPRIAVAILDL